MTKHRFLCIAAVVALGVGAILSGSAKAQTTPRPAPHKSAAKQPYNPLVLAGPRGKPGESTVWRTTIQSEQPKGGQGIPLSDGRFIGLPSAGFQPEFMMDTSDGGVRMKSAWQSTGAEHVFFGKVEFGGFQFDSDASFPLTFQVTTSGYQYFCGKGVVRESQTKVHNIDGNGDFNAWLSRSADPRALVRQGAVEALGWLAKSDSQRQQALKALTVSLRDPDPRVRRDAAEAIGVIGVAPDAKTALAQALRDEKDNTVIKVLKEVSGENSSH